MGAMMYQRGVAIMMRRILDEYFHSGTLRGLGIAKAGLPLVDDHHFEATSLWP